MGREFDANEALSRGIQPPKVQPTTQRYAIGYRPLPRSEGRFHRILRWLWARC